MADDPTNPNPAPDNGGAPKTDPIQDKGNPAGDKSTSDAVALAEKVGKLEAENAALKSYQEKVDPVIQTIWSDQELFNKTTETHNKRLGITPTNDKDKPKDDKIAVTPQPSATEIDNRNAHIKNIVDKFSTDHGITKLEADKQKEINTKVSVELQEMLDPMGNKTLNQIMETVSVTKLPAYLEKAYFLATRTEQIEAAKKEGANQNAGIIGSIPSSSIEESSIALSAKEKDIAAKQGVSEEKYLENKKAILERNGELF